jgi:hypothetical protein
VRERQDPVDTELETLLVSFDASYVWKYGSGVKQGLRELYEKAKREQWNGCDELPWETAVDPEREILPLTLNPLADYGPFRRLSSKEQYHYQHALLAWQLSQFLHGEQGALLTASQLVATVPWIDAKYYASSQTMDEARHVEVFSRYVREKMEWEWPADPNLKRLLDAILLDGRWDLKYLGMQILVEGLAMAAFANLYQLAEEPLLKQLLHNVMRDEARHVAFGVLSLDGFYRDMPESELRDREDFIIDACRLMRDRLVGEEVADVMGFDREEVRRVSLEAPFLIAFRRSLFSRIVPNIKRLGLLSPRVRRAFEEMAILEFEHHDPDAADHALGL